MSQLTPTQVEQIKAIGETLRQARQDKSVLLEEIKVKTYIPVRVLQALETGQVDQLPEAVFIRGFIRRYADMVGLDGLALSLSLSLDSDPPPPIVAPPEPEPPHRDRSFPTVSVSSLRPYLPIAAVVLASLGLIALAPQLGKLVSANRPAPSSPPATPIAPPASPSPIASPSPSPLPAGVEVAVNLTGESWMQVTIDGKPEFEGVLPQGATRNWKAKDKLVLQVGNAGAVSFSFNQAPAKVVGELGEVRELTFTPKGPQPSPKP